MDKKEDKSNCIDFTLEGEIGKTEYNMLKEAKSQYGTTRKMADALGISQSSIVRKLKKHNL